MYVSIVLLFLLLLVFILNVNAFAAEDTANMHYYKYEDFASFLNFPEDEATDVFSHTINIVDCRDLNISVHSLLEVFPMYEADREVSQKGESHRYVVYDLENESRLFVFVDNNVLTNVCRMEPRCTVDEFSTIKRGVSSPNDVVNIDRNTVFNPFIQWGPVSYHCMNDGTFYMIKYKQSLDSSEKFTVDGIEAISKDECLSILSTLLPDDMP